MKNNQNDKLTLNDNDPKVIAARNAEAALFEFYGLKAKDHYITLPGQEIRVRVSEIGSGPTVVIVPGNTGDVFPLASLLAQIKGRRIIAINRPGGGLSEGMDHTTVDIRSFAVNTLETVWKAFNLDKADVIAHSMGAHWSLWLAMDKPALVRTITLLGNPGNVMGGRPPLLLRLLLKPPFNSVLFWLMKALSKKENSLNVLKTMGHTAETINKQPKALNDSYYYFRLLPHYQLSLISLMENVAPLIDADQLKQVSMPGLFLLGSRDNFADQKKGEAIAAAIPDCEFHVIPNAGHLPWMEDPALCGGLINTFIERQ